MLNIYNLDGRLSTSQSLEDPVRSTARCSDKRRGYMSNNSPEQSTEDGRSTATFYYYSVNHQSGLQRNTFSKLSYVFLIHQNVPATNYVNSFEVYDVFIGQKILKL